PILAGALPREHATRSVAGRTEANRARRSIITALRSKVPAFGFCDGLPVIGLSERALRFAERASTRAFRARFNPRRLTHIARLVPSFPAHPMSIRTAGGQGGETMERVSTERLPAAGRLAAWNAMYSSHMSAVEFNAADQHKFDAELSVAQLGPVRLARLSVGGCSVERRKVHIMRDSTRLYTLLL